MQRLIHFALFFSFLICYLEWGTENSGFLFQMEYDMFFSGQKSIESILHPLILIPLAGQLLLLITVFQRSPSRKAAVISIVSLSTLVLMIFLVGILAFNIKIFVSTVPFLLISVYYLFFFKKANPSALRE